MSEDYLKLVIKEMDELMKLRCFDMHLHAQWGKVKTEVGSILETRRRT